MLADELQFTKNRAILHVRRTSKGVTIATKTRQSNITQSHRLMNIEFWSMSMILGVISCRMISTSEIKVSVLIDEEYMELALRSLHAAYHLDAE